ncbi:class I SAM-dependent methyltransferase [Sphingomonas aurantiaca]|uniref:class I SAM-dependent methyltransferase n=1 Tax=Sphingomonas aurantiaca TaxID=185949 RepID=UPI003345F2E3
MGFSFVERRECPACRSQDRVTLVDTPLDGPVIGPVVGQYYRIDPAQLAGGRFFVVECTSCATIYHAQVGGDDLLVTLYDIWLNEVGDPGDKKALAWLAAHPRHSRDGHEVMTAAALLGAPLRGFKTLDFGMGMGLWAGIAKDLGCDSHGFDLSETRMQDARARGIHTIVYDRIPGSQFDFINTEQVMEHVTEPQAVMETLSRGLRKGGLLKISVPAQGDVRASLARVRAGEIVASKDIMPVAPLEHVNALSSIGIERLGRSFGLKRVNPTRLERLRFVWNPANWLSTKPRNIVKELARPFTGYENIRNLTVWLKAEN